MLIRGDRLNESQRNQVLAAFVHRWTHENAKQSYGGRCPGCVQSGHHANNAMRRKWHAYHSPLVSDAEWLAAHAFHFVRDGSRLSFNSRFAEPAFLATEPEFRS